MLNAQICCALRGFPNLMAPNFELCCLSLPQFYGKERDTFDTRQFIRSFGKFCSFRTDICTFFYLNPKKQIEQRFYGSFGAQGLRLELTVSMAMREHLRIHRLSFCLQFFWKFEPKLYWIFNCDFRIWPLCTFTDRISQTHEDHTFWCMQWHQEVIAELIALYIIKFHWVERT